jgi:hypothetical protein
MSPDYHVQVVLLHELVAASRPEPHDLLGVEDVPICVQLVLSLIVVQHRVRPEQLKRDLLLVLTNSTK